MEKSTFAQHSVSKLAEKFKGQNPQTPDRTEVSKNIRRKPPSFLKLQTKNDEEQDKQEKPGVASSQPHKVKSKSSPLIEKLQCPNECSVQLRSGDWRKVCGNRSSLPFLVLAKLRGCSRFSEDIELQSKENIQNSPTTITDVFKLYGSVSQTMGRGPVPVHERVPAGPQSLTSAPIKIQSDQANLVLSPTALLPSPMSPGVMQPAPFFAPPCGPKSPPPQPHQRRPSEDEVPASFEKPAEGNILPSINKGRARHSIKRRPPTRLPRKSSGEEPSGTEETGPTSSVTSGSLHDGDEEDVFQESDSVPKKEREENTSSVLPDGMADGETLPEPQTSDSAPNGETPPEPQTSDSASNGETPPESQMSDSAPNGETPPEVQMSVSASEAPKIQEECKELQPETAEETDDSTGVKKGAPLQEKEDADEGIGM